jgi:hypothetical protein
MTSEIINVGKYKFNIIDNILKTDEGKIYNRNFKIGGNYSDCVNISISYDKYNNPISAKIPTLVHDEECSISSPLDKGEGTIQMIKTLLRYIKAKIPEINEFVFEDKSNIEYIAFAPSCVLDGSSAECGTEEEKHQKRRPPFRGLAPAQRACGRRKRSTNAVPIGLYYFSIAFNCVTWYEKHFNAYQQDLSVHKAYRSRVKDLLKTEKMKPSFDEFLRIAQPPMKHLDELKELYDKTLTYGDFFNSIPKEDRCRLVREWISTFMEHYLKGVFKNTDWVIDVRKMDEKHDQCVRKKGGNSCTRVTKKKKYYCPIGRVRISMEARDMGAHRYEDI